MIFFLEKQYHKLTCNNLMGDFRYSLLKKSSYSAKYQCLARNKTTRISPFCKFVLAARNCWCCNQKHHMQTAFFNLVILSHFQILFFAQMRDSMVIATILLRMWKIIEMS